MTQIEVFDPPMCCSNGVCGPSVDPLLPFGLVGVDALRQMGADGGAASTRVEIGAASAEHGEPLNQLVEQIAARGKGVVMTMGKGGVGKTTLAVRIATQLARAGHHVTLTTTDPAAHVNAAARERPATLHVTRIDPAAETRRYTEGRDHEAVHLRELATHGKRTVLEPWHADIFAADPVGA